MIPLTANAANSRTKFPFYSALAFSRWRS